MIIASLIYKVAVHDKKALFVHTYHHLMTTCLARNRGALKRQVIDIASVEAEGQID